MTIPDPRHAAGTNTPNLLYQKKNITSSRCFTDEGVAINSDFLNGLKTKEAKEKMIEWLENNKTGKKQVQYKLRDWVFSRQRYWGEPIPIVHCEKCGIVPLSENQLPLTLPDVENYEPTDTGESPLANITDWVNTICPKCGGHAKREIDTMPNWAGSSWYFLRYTDPKNDGALADKAKLKYWMQVDLYNGGMEHTTLHLLYSRFWNKFLYDTGVVPFSEPYARRISHGMVLAEDGKKMSKSLGNVINPDDVVRKFGADTLRVYEMFMGPYAEAIPWSTDGLKGVRRFLEKVWNLNNVVGTHCDVSNNKSIKSLLHKTIKKVTEDIDNFKFNTAISAMMILVNEMEKAQNIDVEDYKLLLLILSPFAPHICEELWEEIQVKSQKACTELAEGSKVQSCGSIFSQSWSSYNPDLAKDEIVELVIQINGKIRDKVEVSSNISEDEAKNLALAREKVQEWVKGKNIMKVVFVKGRLVNIVIR
ncbi:MAG: class I tRNA ligase family protein [bacterium]